MTRTLLDIFEHRVNASGTRTALRFKHDGLWERQSWKEWWEHAERLAAGLIDLGVRAGDPVAILSETRVEWAWIDVAATMLGTPVVPIYPSSLPAQCRHILGDAGVRVVFASDPSQLEKIVEHRDELDALATVVLFERSAALDYPDYRGRTHVRLEEVVDEPPGWLIELDALEERGRRLLASRTTVVADRRRQVHPDQVATIAYTSGTSGVPKGVVHTQATLAAEVDAIGALELLGPDDRQLLFLPLSHIFARMLLWAGIGYGVETAFAESLQQVLENLREVEPTFFGSVPRIFEKIHAYLVEDAHRYPGIRQSLFEAAFRRGKRRSRASHMGKPAGIVERVEQELFNKLVYERIQALFGSRVRFLFCGGASLRPDLAEFFHAAGLQVLEGYGLTETGAVSSLNLPDEFRFGSVGKPLPGVDITIAEDDEILIRGPMVTPRYHGLADETEAALEADTGWFHTGDLGRFDRDGFLYITGRKKDVLVTAGGKNVVPAPIERQLRRQPYIGGAIVFGEARPYLTALIAPDFDRVARWAGKTGLAFETPADLAGRREVRELIWEQVQAVNADLPQFEKIKDIAIIERPFDVESGELTATGKVRRDRVVDNHHAVLDALYSSSSE